MEDARHVLVVDDDAATREMLVSLLEDHHIEAAAAAGADEAVEAISELDFDVVLSDIRVPGRGGTELIRELRELRPETPIILITTLERIDPAVSAMQAGAFGYITRPFERDSVLASLDRAFEHRALERENRRLRRALDKTTKFGDLLGTSPAMREIFGLIRKISGSRSNVLISGESGTGKEVVARTLHFAGSRADRPFVPVNCTAMPEDLLERELFGYVRGAFTGAHSTERGLLEQASGGTLFLGEIGDMPLGLQGKLLRVLQDQEIRPVGGNRTVPVDVRVVTATSKNLKKEVELGRFRKDLYYRLNVIPIHIPPLHQRREDIPLLAQAFARKHGGEMARITREGLEKLTQHRWEGNTRELENVIEHAVALAPTSELGPDDIWLGDAHTDRRGGGALEASLLGLAAQRQLTIRELTDLYIAETLKRTGGNKVQAAKLLGINRRTLYRRGNR